MACRGTPAHRLKIWNRDHRAVEHVLPTAQARTMAPLAVEPELVLLVARQGREVATLDGLLEEVVRVLRVGCGLPQPHYRHPDGHEQDQEGSPHVELLQ